MKFIDEATIEVQAGNGGAGCRSFRREKFVPFGGPDGGNGGRGGSVILIADRNKHTLLDFHFRPVWKGLDGRPGGGNQRDGKAGEDLIVHIPIGTQVFSATEPDKLLVDLATDGEQFVIAKGGRGGKGNRHFVSPTRQAPDHFQPGEAGEAGKFRLSLKLVADVGLIGFPNAGKSTLISRVSSARPKIASYPFTTLTPQLGVVQHRGSSFVIADIPGLIEGAHEGRGLGIQFLKHIERTRLLVHLIDLLALDEEGLPIDPLVAFDQVTSELNAFSSEVGARPQIVALTKIDSISERDALDQITARFTERGIVCVLISSVSGEGLPTLLDAIALRLPVEENEHSIPQANLA